MATILKFLSFIGIDIKWFSFNFGGKIFTGFKMEELESWSISLFLLLCSKMGEFDFQDLAFQSQRRFFFTKIEWGPRNMNISEWQKVDECCYTSFIIFSHSIRAILLLSLYWGMNTTDHQCTYYCEPNVCLARNYFWCSH